MDNKVTLPPGVNVNEPLELCEEPSTLAEVLWEPQVLLVELEDFLAITSTYTVEELAEVPLLLEDQLQTKVT